MIYNNLQFSKYNFLLLQGGKSVQRYYIFMNCASFLQEKVFNNYIKLSKTKMQVAYLQELAFFKKLKSFPK